MIDPRTFYPRDPALRWAEHYEFSNALFYAVVKTLTEGSPLPPARAQIEPRPEGGKRKHRRVA